MTPPSRDTKTQRLDYAVSALNQRLGSDTLRPARALPVSVIPPHLSTGFAALDALTGCGGAPLGAITLLTGKTTSGKLTLAYSLLAQAQGRGLRKDGVAILDLTDTSDPDTLQRCGLDLGAVLFVRPPHPDGALRLLFDLLQGGYGLRALLVDGLGDLLRSRSQAAAFDAAMPQLQSALRQSRAALLCLDEPAPPWLAWAKLGSAAIAHAASLHLAIQRATWTTDLAGAITGYTVRAQLVRSRWAKPGGACDVHLPVRM